MNAPDVLKYGQLTLLAGLDGLQDADWEVPGVCGIWSVKQIVAHLASYEATLADVLQGFAGGGPAPTFDRFLTNHAAFNDDEVAARAAFTSADTLAELVAEHERLITLARQISAETFRTPGTIPWYGPEYALDDLIVYINYGHKREHVAQIEHVRDRRAS